MTTYLVIGSNCFTGSHIVDALLDLPGAKVVGVSRSPEYRTLFLPYKRFDAPDFQFHQIDVVREFERLEALLSEAKPEVVINVAALSQVGISNELPVEYFDINTKFVVKLCDELRRCSFIERYVHISSAEILGPCEGAVREDAPFRPSTPYAVSKAAADLFLDTLIQNYSFPATLIRSTNVYGRHQQLFKIIPRAAIYLKLGKIIELHGGGESVKSFIHIRDVVNGLLLSLQRGRPGIYHFSVPSDQTIADVVRLVCTLMDHDFEKCTRVIGERLGQDSRYWLDCSKARDELGWSPVNDFGEGVREALEWIETNWDIVRTEPLNYEHRT